MLKPATSAQEIPALTDEATEALASGDGQGILDLRKSTRDSFHAFARYALPEGQQPAAHHRFLIDALCDISIGASNRLMVLMPPGSAKSTYGSILFAAWWLGQHPETSIIACSHTESLADEFGGRVRRLVADHVVTLNAELAERRARGDFRTDQGGSYYAAGVGSGIAGRRADLIIIDDPVKSHEDADNEHRREIVWSWYRSDLLTRLKPSGRIVLIMTRWHEDDLGGRLLHSDHGWRCIRLPALAEAEDPLGRPPGTALWPEWENTDQLERKRALLGERAWTALYQQSPHPPAETLFKTSKIALVDTCTPARSIRGWDLAATSTNEGSNPDWTVGLKLGREESGRFAILDVVRLRGTPHEVECAITATARADGIDTEICLPQDPGQAGKAQKMHLAQLLPGFRFHITPERGTKIQRATPVACQIEAGNVAMLRAAWTQTLIDELNSFPLGRKDDQVDALARAFAQFSLAEPKHRHIQANILCR